MLGLVVTSLLKHILVLLLKSDELLLYKSQIYLHCLQLGLR